MHSELIDIDAEAGMGHIELAKWADLLLIAPATANTISKLSHGLAEDLASTLTLASNKQIFLEIKIPPKKRSQDENNKNKSLRGRTLVGIDLLSEFEIKNNNQKIFKGGKIYDPRSGNTYKSNLYLSQDGILKVEGCLAFICDGEEWQPLIVKINEDGSREAILKNSPQSN